MRFRGALRVSVGANVAAVLLNFLTLMGCNRQHQTTIAVIPKASADIYWQSVHAGAVKSGLQNKVRVVWDGPPNETDIAGEMKIVETMINRQVDAIALAPSDSTAFKIVIARAAAAHIPVIVYDSGVEGNGYTSFVATDNYLGGQMGADRMGEILGGKGTVVILKNVPGAASSTARESGFRDRLTKKFPGIRIVDERFGMASLAQALTVAENMLSAFPGLGGIFASSESGTEGASQAVRNRKSNVRVVGFDSSPMLISQLQAGVIDSLIIQDPFRMGETATDQAAKAIRGEKISREIFLPPKLVNAANLNDPAVQRQLMPDLQTYLSEEPR
jgi:ribose transport system substrate-binding protein